MSFVGTHNCFQFNAHPSLAAYDHTRALTQQSRVAREEREKKVIAKKWMQIEPKTL